MKRVFKYIFLIITIILFTSTKVRAEDKWIGECHYAINDPSTGAVAYTVDIFFNDQKLSPQVSTGGGFIDFELNDILNYYRKYSACPIKYS